jgi:hypothetical protein
MSPDLVLPWLAAFVVTQLVEGPIYALWMRRDFSVLDALLRSSVLQLTTHPLLWLVFFDLMDAVGGYALAVVVAESCVVALEGALLAWMWPAASWRRAFAAALTANAVSTVVGLLR